MMSLSAMYRQISKTDCKVVLDGTGGDEVFGGYWDRQFPIAFRAAIARGDMRWLSNFLWAHAGDWRKPARSFRWMTRPPSTYVPRSVTRFAREPGRDVENRCPLAGGNLSFEAALRTDVLGGRMSDWLWQNDRNAMSYGLEARSPLLDYRLMRYLTTGYARKFSGKFNKMELRKALSNFVELPTQWRATKQGFNWQTYAFRDRNLPRILDLMAASDILLKVFDRDQLLHTGKTDKSVVKSRAFERAMMICGVEVSLQVTL